MDTTTTAPDQLFGYDVTDSNGNKIGSVDHVWVDDATNELEFVGVKTGWIFGHTHVIPMADAQVGDGAITVPYTSDQIKNAPSFSGDDELSPDQENEVYQYYGLDRSTQPSPTGLPAGGEQTTGQTNTWDQTTAQADAETTEGDIAVPVSEEELAVGKREVQAGQVRLRKVVNTEHQTVPVELRREEVQIERVPADDATTVPDSAFQEQQIDVPVMREEPVAEKRAHVTGEVRLDKNVATEQRTVEGDVRREDVEVDKDVDTIDSPTTS